MGERAGEGGRGRVEKEKTAIARSGSVDEKRRKMSRDMNLQVVIEDTKADKTTPTMAMTTTHPPMFFHTKI